MDKRNTVKYSNQIMRYLFVFLVLSSSTIHASTFTCPKFTDIEVTATKPSEFEVYPKHAKYKLVNIKVSTKHPRNLLFLKPDPHFLRTNSEGAFWLSCIYKMENVPNMDSQIYLTKIIPREYTKCTLLKQKKSEYGYGISCKI
jgi:hypothetical protein